MERVLILLLSNLSFSDHSSATLYESWNLISKRFLVVWLRIHQFTLCQCRSYFHYESLRKRLVKLHPFTSSSPIQNSCWSGVVEDGGKCVTILNILTVIYISAWECDLLARCCESRGMLCFDMDMEWRSQIIYNSRLWKNSISVMSLCLISFHWKI